MRRVTDEQRRRLLGVRHHLATRSDDLVGVADDLCGVHSSDAATVMLAARARVAGFTVAAAERALYEDRTLARVLLMRRTLFVVPTTDVATFHAATTRALYEPQRRRTLGLLSGDGGVVDEADAEAWLARVEEATLDALHRRGEATAAELTDDVPELGLKVQYKPEKAYGGAFGVSTRVLFLLATEGRIVRGRPRGSWLSTQYRWAPVDTWFPVEVDVDTAPTDVARAELAHRWLAAFGPATFDDVRWWTGWGKRDTRAALADVGPDEVELDDGRTGLVAPGDALTEADADVGRWVALLPSLDPTTMGWRERGHHLDPALVPALFDRNGNAGATIWADGRVVGGWAQRPDGEVATRLLVDVGAETAEAVEAEAAALTEWAGGVRVTPRFRTPLERELSS